jgi:hypothetical protein
MRHALFASLLTVVLATLALGQTNPVPTIYASVSPLVVKPGSGAFTLTVTGFGFAPTAVLTWNGETRLTEVVSNSKLQADINAEDVATTGTAEVVVINPAPGGGSSNVVLLPIRTESSSVGMGISSDYIVGGALVVGDFNGDGKLDVVVGYYTSKAISIKTYLGNGDGTFQKAITSPSLLVPYFMITGDFNGDGKLDFAAGSYSGNYADTGFVFYGKGDGTFTQASKPFTDYGIPEAVGDFNGDGKLDIVAMAPEFGGETIYLNNGDGTFTPGIYFDSETGVPAVGDFNHDGHLDLAFPGREGVDVYLGNGDGTFLPLVYYTATGYAQAAVAADINGDGNLDIITDGIGVLLGNGDGTFAAAQGFTSNEEAATLNVADFNGDGKLDVAIGTTAGVSIHLGDGTGNLGSAIQYASLSAGYGLGYAMGDFNSDGKLDLILSSTNNEGTLTTLFLQTSLLISATQLNFFGQGVGTTSAPLPVTLTNIGVGAIPVPAITITGAGSAPYSQTNDCGSSLPAGASCLVEVTYTPTQPGVRSNGTLNLAESSTISNHVALTGYSTSTNATLTPSSLNFPDTTVGTSATLPVTLTNSGLETLTISSIHIYGVFSETNNCGANLTAGASCIIQVKFTPTSASTDSNHLYIYDNAGDGTQSIPVNGTGVQ